jgi:multidrug/hemolysin transport system permease protein
MAVFIILGLYILFLGNNVASGLEEIPESDVLVGAWLMGGILAVISVTTTMGAFGIMVEDRAKKILKDFSSSPISRASLTAGFIGSAILVGLIMSFITLALVGFYLVSIGGALLSGTAFVKAALTIVLSVLSSSAMVFS